MEWSRCSIVVWGVLGYRILQRDSIEREQKRGGGGGSSSSSSSSSSVVGCWLVGFCLRCWFILGMMV